jgi:hypothetical protein
MLIISTLDLESFAPPLSQYFPVLFHIPPLSQRFVSGFIILSPLLFTVTTLFCVLLLLTRIVM